MIRTRIAVFGLLAIAVLSILDVLLDVTNLNISYSVAAADEQAAELRAALPHSGTVGLIDDAKDVQLLTEWYLAQYSLAPVVVAKNADHKLVIDVTHQPGVPIPQDFDLVGDFGNGVRLLRNRTK